MRANALMKVNVAALLRARGQTQKDLAQWCRRSETWISKIMKQDHREFPMKYFDRIADFFGVATYQLLQPGLTQQTERRKNQRRVHPDRRVSAVQKGLRESVSELAAGLTAEDVALLLRARSLSAEDRQLLEASSRALPKRGSKGSTVGAWKG
jgi:hypothetical protein